MYRTAVRMLPTSPRGLGATLGVLLLSCSLVSGQQPLGGSGGGPAKTKPAEKPAGKSLEDLLAAALKNNPDIRVAEAKVREAEAELNRARLQTTQKLVTLYRGLEAQKALAQSAEAEAERIVRLHQMGTAPTGSMESSRQKTLQAKAKVSELEAELAYLTGQQPAGSTAERLAQELERALYAQSFAQAQLALANEARRTAVATKVQGSTAERLRKALDTEVTVDFQNELNVIVKLLEERTGGIPIVARLDGGPQINLNLSFKKPVPLGAALQAIEDAANVRCIVREYGFFLTGPHSGLPPGTVLLSDFWRGGADPSVLKPPVTEPKK